MQTREELPDYQVRIQRNTFRDPVRKDIEETVQRPGGKAGPMGFEPELVQTLDSLISRSGGIRPDRRKWEKCRGDFQGCLRRVTFSTLSLTRAREP